MLSLLEKKSIDQSKLLCENSNMLQKTILYDEHVKAGAKIVDFAGWQMPLHYGSQVVEHHQVRRDAGMFDVSHMQVVDVQGAAAKNYLQYLLANDVAKLYPGKALYSCMLNERAGVVDDLIVYQLAENNYRLVLNAGTREKDLAWLKKHAENFAVSIQSRPDFAIIAIQGPHAREKTAAVFCAEQRDATQDLKTFHAALIKDWLIARTGYTGEDGYEIILPVAQAINFWQALCKAGVAPCGLGSRDTLRLEAGLNLYGSDMNEDTTPLESNLAWTIAWQPIERNFIGRNVLEKQKQQGVMQKLIGLLLPQGGVLRNHQVVHVAGVGQGEITSGSFSPTLNCAIALARVPIATAEDKEIFVEMRGKQLAVQMVKTRFVGANK
jgi:aminomethyltransferase